MINGVSTAQTNRLPRARLLRAMLLWIGLFTAAGDTTAETGGAERTPAPATTQRVLTEAVLAATPGVEVGQRVEHRPRNPPVPPPLHEELDPELELEPELDGEGPETPIAGWHRPANIVATCRPRGPPAVASATSLHAPLHIDRRRSGPRGPPVS